MADELNAGSVAEMATVDTGAGGSASVDQGGEQAEQPVTGTPAVAQPGGEPQQEAQPANELEAYLAEQLKEQEGTEAKPGEAKPGEAPADAGPLPEAVTAALGISEFVKEPAHLQAAVQAADEVWRVQTGELPAWQMIEGVKAYSPERYQAIINELVPYLEHVTGKKLGGGAGAEATGPKDPVAELRAENAERDRVQQEQQQAGVWERQVNAVKPVLHQTVVESLGKTFGEEDIPYFMSRIGAVAKIDEKQMVAELAKGNKAPLEEAIKTVRREELQRFARYNKALVQQAKSFKAAVPATKPATQTPVSTGEPSGGTGWTREQSAEYLKTGVAPV